MVEMNAGRAFRLLRKNEASYLRMCPCSDNNPDRCPFGNISLSIILFSQALCELWAQWHAQDRLVSFLPSTAHFPVALLNTRRPLTFRKGQPQNTSPQHTDRLIKLRLERILNPQILCSERRPLWVMAILSQIHV